jgi:hypothetical protein
MRRREPLLGFIVSASATWPITARAQRPARTYRMAMVHPNRQPADMTETSVLTPA